jgi:hypothetical protein
MAGTEKGLRETHRVITVLVVGLRQRRNRSGFPFWRELVPTIDNQIAQWAKQVERNQ